MPEEENKKKKDDNQNDEVLKSDPGTVHTTDPQKNMEGPISSIIKKLGEGFDDKDAENDKDKEKRSREQ